MKERSRSYVRFPGVALRLCLSAVEQVVMAWLVARTQPPDGRESQIFSTFSLKPSENELTNETKLLKPKQGSGWWTSSVGSFTEYKRHQEALSLKCFNAGGKAKASRCFEESFSIHT